MVAQIPEPKTLNLQIRGSRINFKVILPFFCVAALNRKYLKIASFKQQILNSFRRCNDWFLALISVYDHDNYSCNREVALIGN